VKKKLKASQRREEIIKATIKVVAKSNFDKATIANIAKAAQINESLIYQHFDNKTDLMVSVLEYIKDDIFRVAVSAPEPGDPTLNALRQSGRAYYNSVNANIDILKCIQASTMAGDKKIREKSLEFIKFTHKFLEDKLKLAMENNLISTSFDPDTFAWIIFGGALMSSMLLIFGENDLMTPDEVDIFYEQLEKLMK
jgi:AcrR family transcriptional regulator